MQPSPVISLSPTPSFTSYSSSRLAEIAARVVEEFRTESYDYGRHGEDYGGGNSFLTDYEESLRESGTHFRHKLIIDEEKSTDKNGGGGDEKGKDEGEEEDEGEFEFAVVGQDFVSSPTPADEIFFNGQIRPCFPLFNQDLLLDGADDKKEVGFTHHKSPEEVRPSPVTTAATRRLSLSKLFTEDRDPPSSCSSSEADELDGVKPDSYCVWNPKAAAAAAAAAAAEEGRCKKSSSTGSCSSKRWRFRGLLHRSNSEGKDSLVFLPHSESRNARKNRGENIEKIDKLSAVAPEIPKPTAGKDAPPTAVYVKNDGERRRMSFLPYRRDLVGFFSNMNGLSRNLHPF